MEKKSKDWLLTGKLCPNTKTTEFVIHFAVLKLVFCKHNTWLSNCYYELLNNRPFLGFDNLTCMQPLRVSTSKENQEVNTTGPRKILIKVRNKRKIYCMHDQLINPPNPTVMTHREKTITLCFHPQKWRNLGLIIVYFLGSKSRNTTNM